MESPPSCSAWSGFVSSEDSGLLITSGSVSSGIEYADSEDERLYCEPDDDSLCDEADFNTVKKNTITLAAGVGWREKPIEPPIEFQDSPPPPPLYPLAIYHRIQGEESREDLTSQSSRSRKGSLSPRRRRSLSASSRLSSSHNSLSVPVANRVDDSSFITSAMSHDVLSDLYNVPLDGDVYALPIDSIRPHRERHKKHHRHGKRRRRHTALNCNELGQNSVCEERRGGKRHSTPGPIEPVHMTLQEVRQFLHTLYSSGETPSEGSISNNNSMNRKNGGRPGSRRNDREEEGDTRRSNNNDKRKQRKHSKMQRVEERRGNESSGSIQKILEEDGTTKKSSSGNGGGGGSVKMSFSHLLKRTLCNVFRVKKPMVRETEGVLVLGVPKVLPPFAERALPPLPDKPVVPSLITQVEEETGVDFASSIEKVKDYGWYWGPISGEAAEKILSNEPDGSFIVRDSSDHHYIFSLTFRLNGCVRHVRIEHDQGNFSFGSCTKFKSQTIVEFIETAVEHSRSGRYLFFLHRRPVLGPMRVQLLHPVSRFKHVQSLQHMCRFVIVKTVRRDLIASLPLPRRLIDYLSSPHYYSEQLTDHQDQPSSPPSLHLFSFLPPN